MNAYSYCIGLVVQHSQQHVAEPYAVGSTCTWYGCHTNKVCSSNMLVLRVLLITTAAMDNPDCTWSTMVSTMMTTSSFVQDPILQY